MAPDHDCFRFLHRSFLAIYIRYMDSTLDGFSLPELGWDWATAFAQNEHPFDPLHNSMIYEANSTDFLFDPISASVVTPTVGLGSAAPAALGEQTLGGVEINWDILSNDCFMQCFTTTAPSFANTATSVSHLDGGTQNVVGYEENRAVELSLQDLATIEDVLSRAADSCLAHPSPSNWAEGCAQPNPDIQEDYTKGDEISGTLSTQSDAHERESQHINPIDAEERRGYPYWGAEHSDQPPSYVSTPILRRAQGLHTLKDPKPGERPPYNLRTLIKMAILGCPDQRLQIDQIFEQIMGRFEYYRLAESKKSVGWKNSIRHQLSLYACFVKREKERGEVGRGVWWTVDESADPKATKRQLKRGQKTPYECTESISSRKRSDSRVVRSGNHSQARPIMSSQGTTYRPLPAFSAAKHLSSSLPMVPSTRSSGSTRSKLASFGAEPLTPRSKMQPYLSFTSRPLQARPSQLLTANPASILTRVAGASRPKAQKSEGPDSLKPYSTPAYSVRPLPSRVYAASWTGTNPLKFGRGTISNLADSPAGQALTLSTEKGYASSS